MYKALAIAGLFAAVATGCSNGQLATPNLASPAGLVAATPMITTQSVLSRTVGTQIAGTTVAFSDTFEQGAVGSPATGWSVLSGAWQVCQPPGDTHEYCQVESHVGITTPAVSNSGSWKDYEVDASLFHSSASGSVALLGRMRDASHFYELSIHSSGHASDQRWNLNVYNGQNKTLASGPLTQASIGQFAQIRLMFAGSSITAYAGQSQLASISDSTYGSGGVGLLASGTTTSAFDNVLVTLSGGSPSPSPNPTATPNPTGHGNVIAGCQMFPPSDYWNLDISQAPTDPNSAAMINAARTHGVSGGMTGVNEQEYVAVVPYNQPKATMHQASGHTFAQQWPIGGGFTGPFQGANDTVLMIVQQAGGGNPCKIWESGGTHLSGNTWSAYGGGVWNADVPLTPWPLLCSDSGCGGTGISTDGMPVRILGNARADEIAVGKITHAMEGEFPQSSTCGQFGPGGQNLYNYPAIGSAQGYLAPPCLPGASKIRLRASYPETGLSPSAVTMLEGLKHFGISVGDNGCCWGVYWSHPLGTRPGDGSGDGFDTGPVNSIMGALRITDFEVIKLGPTNGAKYPYPGSAP